ncbi:winged helix-turn-helix domain-containing protein [Micromonospora sp. NPDC006766]|uniref:winged helix-turn-helix domain-containing protein n=1 Tax=Micromonospora sp. NPDC006766 TaxID=3154778 RepID=UPI0033DDB7EA
MPAEAQWAQLADYLRERIESGELAPGERLPSTKQLAEEHGVAYSVVRQAMHDLYSQGWVEVVRGVGVFVAEQLPDASDKPDR